MAHLETVATVRGTKRRQGFPRAQGCFVHYPVVDTRFCTFVKAHEIHNKKNRCQMKLQTLTMTSQYQFTDQSATNPPTGDGIQTAEEVIYTWEQRTHRNHLYFLLKFVVNLKLLQKKYNWLKHIHSFNIQDPVEIRSQSIMDRYQKSQRL